MALRFALLSAALVACATQAGAASVALQGDGVALAIQTTATTVQSAPVLGSQADLSLSPLDGLQTDFRFGAETGTKAAFDNVAFASPWIAPTASDRWSSGRFGLGAQWSLSPLARIELAADDQIRHEVDRTVASWTETDDQQQVFTHNLDARAGLILSPAAPLNLRFNGEAIDAALQTVNLAGAAAGTDLLRTRTERTSAAMQWKPFSKLSLEGGGQLETIGVAWAGSGPTAAGARTDDYTYVEPRVTAGLTPWDGATLKLGVERAVAPIRKDQFISFAQVADRTVGPMFAPDQEWRYQASWQEDLGDGVAFNAAYTHGQLINATDLGPIGTSQAPMSIGSGERDQVQAGFAAPINLAGLLPLTVKASASWRNSRVQDPFTGAARRLSGETPYDAQLTLSPQAANAILRWGLSARASGAATTYQMSQTSTQQVGAGLGGFVEYRPGPVAVQLRLDNLVGGDLTERDVYFAGSRDANMIDRIAETHSSNRVFMLSLVRPL